MNLNDEMEICIPQSLTKVISSNVQNGGIPNFNNLTSLSHYATGAVDDEKFKDIDALSGVYIPKIPRIVAAIPQVRSADVLGTVENVSKTKEIKREQNQCRSGTRMARMIPVLGAPVLPTTSNQVNQPIFATYVGETESQGVVNMNHDHVNNVNNVNLYGLNMAELIPENTINSENYSQIKKNR